MPPPFFCQELFRDPDKTQVIGVLEARMTRFLITWKVVCTCPCVCVHAHVYAQRMFTLVLAMLVSGHVEKTV